MAERALLVAFESVASAVQLAVCALLVRRVFGGAGTAKLPYGQAGIPEAKWLPLTYCLVQATIHMLKAGSHAQQSGFLFNNLPYVDYLLTCPLILADMFITMRMPGVIIATVTCLCSLLCAVMTFQTEGSARALAFGFGLLLFLSLFSLVFTQLRAKLPQLPAASMRPLYIAMGMFFGMWPLFPLLWVFGPVGMGVLPPVVYTILHILLDIACKSVFALALQTFRAAMEDTGVFYSYTLLNPHFAATVHANLSKGVAAPVATAKVAAAP